MSVLEKFFILFDADAEGVKKGAKEAGKATDGLEDKVKKTDAATKKLGSGFHGMVKSAVGAFAAIASVGAVISGVFNAADYADQLGKTSDALGVNIEDWAAWRQAVKLAGGSGEGLEQSLRGLQDRITDISVKGSGEALDFFKKLNISIKDTEGNTKSALELLPELAEAFEGMDASQVQGIGQKLGLDPGTIMLLQKGRREVEASIRQQKELGAVTKEDAEIAAKFHDALDNLRYGFTLLFTKVGSVVLPVLTSLANGMMKAGKFAKEYGGIIEGALWGVAAIATVLIVKFGVLAAIATASWLAMTLPVWLFIAGFAAAVLLFDDFKNFFMGAPSLVGTAMDAVTGSFRRAGVAIKQIWDEIWKYISGIFTAIADKFSAITALGAKIGGAFSFGDSEVEQTINIGKGALAGAANNPMAGQSSASILQGGNRTSNRSVSIGEVNIKTQATDSDGISREIGRSLQSEMNSAANNFDDGIRG